MRWIEPASVLLRKEPPKQVLRRLDIQNFLFDMRRITTHCDDVLPKDVEMDGLHRAYAFTRKDMKLKQSGRMASGTTSVCLAL